ncbi:MAG: rRNA maturation RNase YbeY [Opitutales bacterium]|nr:rRNA maturation RNase YbeY [Opitutales bacterium]
MTLRPVDICHAHPGVEFPAGEAERMIHALDEHPDFHCPPGQLSLAIVTDAEIARVHADFLQDPTPTDGITFPGDPEEDFAGEILVSADTACRYARENNVDFARELTLYLTHGFLHLCGWDDRSPDQRKAMKETEKIALRWLDEKNVIPSFTWKGTLPPL